MSRHLTSRLAPAARRAVLALIVILAAALWPAVPVLSAPASQTAADLQLDVRAGFDGYVQPGVWTPLYVTASNSGPDLSAELRVEASSLAGAPVAYTRPIDLPRGSRKLVTLYVPDLSAYSGTVQVDLVRSGRVMLSQQASVQSVAATTLLIGVWSDSPQALADLALVQPSSGQTRLALLTAADLPEIAAGWQALDVLAIFDADTGVLTPGQRAALAEWIAGGGRLLVAGGAAYQRTAAGLGDVLPLLPDGTASVSLEPLARLAGAPFDAQAVSEAAVTTGDLHPDAYVQAAAGDVPLLAWREIGYGRVDFLTADPGMQPLRAWPGRAALWTAVLSSGRPRPAWAFGFSESWQPARDAVADIPGVSLPSALQLCGFLTLYVVLIGPVNYLVLARLKRRELAWFTIPALIVLFSAIAYLTGFQLRGTRAIVHRLALVQTWGDTTTARVQGLVGIWSPRRARYDVLFDPGYMVRPLPPDFGTALTSAAVGRVDQGEAVTLRGIPVDVGSVQPFVVEGFTASAPRITGALTLSEEGLGLRVRGEIVNASNLDFTDAALIIAGTTLPLGNLAAGAVLPVDLLTGGGAAVPAPASPLDPSPGSAGYGYYYGYTYYDEFITTVAGGDCYSQNEYQRRCNLFNSVLNGQSRGAGAYLSAWSSTVPFGMQVLNAPADTIDTMLVIAALEVTLAPAAQQRIEVPPGLMMWQSLNDPNLYAVPYNMYLYPGGEYAFRYAPSALVPPLTVEMFTIHLGGEYVDDFTPPPLVEAFDFTAGQWVSLPVNWGDTPVMQPDRYIDASGGMALRLSLPQGSQSFGLTIPRFDVTLYGQAVGQ